jgi:hypothetical protein
VLPAAAGCLDRLMADTVTRNTARELAAILRTGAGPVARGVLENGGAIGISALAELLERHPGDKALNMAISVVCAEGYWKLEGATRNRRLVRVRPLRVARICSKCSGRVFGDFGWKCDQHPGSTVDQENRPYDDPRVDWTLPSHLMMASSGFAGFASMAARVESFGVAAAGAAERRRSG